MENNILDILSEVSSKESATRKPEGTSHAERMRHFIEFASGEVEAIDTPAKMKKFLDAIESFKPGDDLDQTRAAGDLKKDIKKLPGYTKAKSILAKIAAGDKISDEEAEEYDIFADDVESAILAKSMSSGSSLGGSGGKVNRILWDNSFPVCFESDDGKTYCGLLRAPSGVITWQGDSAREAARAIGIPIKLDLMKPEFRLTKNKTFKGLPKSFKFKEDDATKAKVKELYQKFGGALVEPKGEITGLNKVLKTIGFWDSIKTIL